MSRYIVFDVESIGIHGEGFAVGWVVIEDGREVNNGRLCCPPSTAKGSEEGRSWIAKHIAEMAPTCDCPTALRVEFWHVWQREKTLGSVLVADCPWPVEARFLLACIEDGGGAREWGGPYPFIDVASVRLAAGFDPLAVEERRPNERPVHDPEADARQSARLFMEALSEAIRRVEGG